VLLGFLDGVGERGLVFTDAERGHEGRFGVGLQRFAGFAVDADDLTVWVAGQVDADFDLDFAKFFLNLLLFDFLGLVQDGAQSTGDASDFVEEGKFTFVERSIWGREAVFQALHNLVQRRLDRIRLPHR
jgi:hypothetical protein